MKYALLLSILLTLPAQAQVFTGNKLMETFNKSETSNIDWGVTRGYVAGVYDSNLNTGFCPPSNVTLGQVTDMAKNYIENNPAVRHLPADAIILYMLDKSWPCAKKGKSL